jgi:hypothetical protein
MRKIPPLILSLVLITIPVHADTHIPAGPVSGFWAASGSPYLIEGTITVLAGDSLTIAPACTILFQGNYKLIVQGWLLAVGTQGDSIIFTSNSASASWHGLRFENSADSSRLSYCVIRYGEASGAHPECRGGGIYCDHSHPVIAHCSIRQNTAVDGGGLSCYNYSNPVISQCAITGNQAGMGGGVRLKVNSSPSITNCQIQGNVAEFNGGGINCTQNCNSIIRSCVITGNQITGSPRKGGGIYCDASSPVVTNCTITNNSAYNGGGIFLYNSTAVIDSNTVTDNIGAGLYYKAAGPVISHDLIADNSVEGIFADSLGSGIITECTIQHNACGIHLNHSSPGIVNSIVTENFSFIGAGILCENDSDPLISRCLISNNEAWYSGGGIAIEGYCDPLIQYCIIYNNSADGVWGDMGGGGIYCGWEQAPQPTINNCVLYGNTTACNGGGIGYDNFSIPHVSDCLFQNNSAGGYGGGMSCIPSTYAQINRCRFVGNSAANGGGIRINCSPVCFLTTCSFVDNQANSGGGMYIFGYESSNSRTVDKCTFYANRAAVGSGIYCYYSCATLWLTNSILWGNSPVSNQLVYSSGGVSYSDVQGGWTGVGNINEDPEFISAANYDTRLLSNSPCIDSGNASVIYNDPDGTRADMGAFYYDQSLPLRVSLRPHEIPSLIPTEGGRLDYTIYLSNRENVSHLARVWCDLTLPDGTIFGPVQDPLIVTVGPGLNLSRKRNQAIPATAAMGVYLFNVYAVVGSDTSKDSFIFGKLGSGAQGLGCGGWAITGDDFVGGTNATVSTSGSRMPSTMMIFPNPFNPSTAISYQLTAFSHVNLKVYDTAGRLVTTLVDKQGEAGAHEVTFDGSALASGIYLARLTAGDFTATQKLVLVK